MVEAARRACRARTAASPARRRSITMSGGESLDDRDDALAALALIKASPNGEYEAQIRAAVDWLNAQPRRLRRSGATRRRRSSASRRSPRTPSTSRQMQAAGAATLIVNGKRRRHDRVRQGPPRRAGVERPRGELARRARTRSSSRLDGGGAAALLVAIEYRSARRSRRRTRRSPSRPSCSRTRSKMGEGVTLRAHVENTHRRRAADDARARRHPRRPGRSRPGSSRSCATRA